MIFKKDQHFVKNKLIHKRSKHNCTNTNTTGNFTWSRLHCIAVCFVTLYLIKDIIMYDQNMFYTTDNEASSFECCN